MSSIPEGEDVLAFVSRLGAGDAWVSGVGAVEGLELGVLRGIEEEVVRVHGRVTLVSLSGPASGPLMAIVARADTEMMKVFAGRLVKARSAGVTVSVASEASAASNAAVTAAGGASAGASAGGTSSSAASASGASSARATSAAPAAPGWADLAAIKPPPDEDEEADELPKGGDRVDHGVFGLCDVMVVKGDRMKIRDVHGTGRLREVHVGAFRILRPVVRDGKRVFKLGKRG